MADCKSSDCHPVTFACMSGGQFFFQVDDDGLESDTFMKSEKKPSKTFIYNKRKKCLILHTNEKKKEKCLEFVPDGCPFDIQMYKNSEPGSHVAVILSVNYMEKKHIVCCSGTSVVPEVEPLPSVISDTKHKAVFYLIRDPKGYKLESSVKRRHYLGLESMLPDSLPFLALVNCEGQEGQDEPDERVDLELHPA